MAGILEGLAQGGEPRALLFHGLIAQGHDHADGLQGILVQLEAGGLKAFVDVFRFGQHGVGIQAAHNHHGGNGQVLLAGEQGMNLGHLVQKLPCLIGNALVVGGVCLGGNCHGGEHQALAAQQLGLALGYALVCLQHAIQPGLGVFLHGHAAQGCQIGVAPEVAENSRFVLEDLAAVANLLFVCGDVLCGEKQCAQRRDHGHVESSRLAYRDVVVGDEVDLCLELLVHDNFFLTNKMNLFIYLFFQVKLH